MKFALNDLGIYAQAVLDYMDYNDILSILNFDKLIGTETLVAGSGRDFISCAMQPSSQSFCRTVSYIVPGSGIPLEIKINEDFAYSLLIVKCQVNVDGYEPFAHDGFNNIVQNKTMRSLQIPDIKKELRLLVDLSQMDD